MTKHTLYNRANERGAVSGLMVAVIALAVLVLGLGSFAIWAYVSYSNSQTDVQGKIAIAVAQAQGDQSDKDEAKYLAEQNQQTKAFKAPDDYCGLTFQYPKSWSAYDSEQISNGGDFRAYFNPDVVPSIDDDTQQFALHVLIEQKDFDAVLAQYQDLITKGLKQSTGASNGQQYTRLTGDFSKNIRGDAVIYQCRDKTITIQTDADTFKDEFNAIIQTVNFNA